MAARIMARQGCGRSGIPAITRPMCSIPTATMWRSATSPGFTNNVCAAHAPSRRADTPDWCIPRLGSCAASRFTADGCRLCCSTPELSAIPKLARNGLLGSANGVPTVCKLSRHGRGTRRNESTDCRKAKKTASWAKCRLALCDLCAD